jgi:hypothetical protein
MNLVLFILIFLMKCKDCQIEKDIYEFYFRKETSKYRTNCKECVKKLRKIYRKENYDKVIESKKEYYNNNQEKCCKRSRDWYKNNKEIKNQKHTVYIRTRRQNDIRFKIYSNIQSRIYSALKNESIDNKKTDLTLDIIGCSIDFYKNWLEFQFNEKMNWNNHGEYWHIDHVKPCASFNLLDKNQIKECFNWKNVRPIEKVLNLIKNDKIDIDLIYNHKNIVNSFATRVNLKKFTGPEYTGV